MEINISQIDLKDFKSYKNKKIISILKKLTDEQVNTMIDSTVIEFISTLDYQTISFIFRNSSGMMQNKLWTNDNIQRILIFGTLNINDFVCSEQTIRAMENLRKVIKSSAIKKQIYNNKYFIHVVISSNKIDNRFFYSYDLKKVFDGMVQSEEFQNLTHDKQLRLIEKLNEYTREVLLPIDFRTKYKNIEKILFQSDRDKIGSIIMEQLNSEELFFLDYISDSIDNNNAIRNYLIETVKVNGKSFDDFFEDMKRMDDLIKTKICDGSRCQYYYNSVSLQEKIYHILLKETDDEIIKEKLLKYLVCRILKGSSVNPEMMYNTLKRNFNNRLLSYKDVNILTNHYDEVTTDLKLTFYIKFNIALPYATYLQGITPEQLSKINVKHVNKLAKFLEDKTQDELSALYGLCIKMYFIFGYERSIEILSNQFGQFNRRFLDNVAKTDVSRVEMKAEGSKYLPVIDSRFIHFMFETQKSNHFIDMFQDKNSELYKRWYYLYNNYDEILEKCHNEITLKKVISILEAEKYDVDRKLITPDNYLLNHNSFLENIILGNKTKYSNNEVLRKVNDIYSKMKQRVESSIPYVRGKGKSGYTYEVMKLDDIQIFELGYKANCCIRTLDIAHNHLLHAALCRNGRVLIIYDKLGDIAAFCPLKRNGNVLIANSIECVDKQIKKNGHFMLDAFNEAIESIVNISKQSNEPIHLVCIGRNSSLKPDAEPFPNNYPTPTIFEKDDETYKNTDIYHKSLDIVYQDINFSFKNIQSKNPSVSYMDPREEVKYFDFFTNRFHNDDEKENMINIINSIHYSANPDNYTPISKYSVRTVYCAKDWYIAETYQGLIGEYLETDYRAKEEFDSYMDMLDKKESPKVLKKGK